MKKEEFNTINNLAASIKIAQEENLLNVKSLVS